MHGQIIGVDDNPISTSKIHSPTNAPTDIEYVSCIVCKIFHPKQNVFTDFLPKDGSAHIFFRNHSI